MLFSHHFSGDYSMVPLQFCHMSCMLPGSSTKRCQILFCCRISSKPWILVFSYYALASLLFLRFTPSQIWPVETHQASIHMLHIDPQHSLSTFLLFPVEKTLLLSFSGHALPLWRRCLEIKTQAPLCILLQIANLPTTTKTICFSK